jgi:enamine deaminase RidA (YjgF/YER057c/UK114 family)
MTAIKRHEPESGLLSNAVEAGGLVFLAGSVADDLDLDIAGQTRQALAYIDTMLGRCGTSKSRLVSATVWLADMAEAPAYNAVWKAWVDPQNLPARATVEAKLFSPKCRIEIMCVAAK